MAPSFFSTLTSLLPRSPTTNSTHTSPIVQQPLRPCPDCECHRNPPATNAFQPAERHRRFCPRHHIKLAADANTRIFQSDEIKDAFKGLLWGGLRFGNDQVSLLDLTDKQRQALRSWDEVQLPLGDGISTPFQLMPCFDMYDGYFFCGALRGRVDVVWVNTCPKEGQKGYTVDAPGPRHRAKICMKRPGAGHTTWTPLLVKESLETLLHEMIHALFNVYECRCATCTTVENQASNTGVQGSGHGPNWRELGQAVEEEANKMFGTFEERCNLDVGRWSGSHVEEVRTVLEMRKEGRIGAIDGLVDALLA